MSRIYLSEANPIQFVWESRSKAPAYNDYPFGSLYGNEMVYEWEEPAYYEYKWQITDSIRLQFLADFVGIQLRLINQDTLQELATNMTQKQADVNNPGFHIYEVDISLVDVPTGNYILRGIAGSDSFVSIRPLCIQVKHEGTVYIEYYHRQRKSDLIFEKGFRPSLRVEMRFDKREVGSKDVVYEDQPLNTTLIDSRQYKIFPVEFGNEYGIPDDVLITLNYIFGMDNVRINGKQFCKAEAGQDFEEKIIEGYPLRGYRYKLRESLNRASNIIDPNVNVNRRVIVMATAPTDIFGDMENVGNNQILIKNYD